MTGSEINPAELLHEHIIAAHISPFQHTAVQVQQRAHTVAGRMVGLEIGRMVADPCLNDLGNLQNLATIEPAIRLATTDPRPSS